MAKSEKKTTIKFPSLSVILGAIFITLKLCGKIAWSWVWVLSPFWIGAIISILSLAVVGIVGLVAVKVMDKLDEQGELKCRHTSKCFLPY